MKIQLKRSNVLDGGAAKEPTAAQMEFGELAVNYNQIDPSIFMKDANGNIIRIAGNDAVGNDPSDIEGYPDLGDGEGATLDDRYLKLGASAGAQVVQSTDSTEFKGGVMVSGGTAAVVKDGLGRAGSNQVNIYKDSESVATFGIDFSGGNYGIRADGRDQGGSTNKNICSFITSSSNYSNIGTGCTYRGFFNSFSAIPGLASGVDLIGFAASGTSTSTLNGANNYGFYSGLNENADNAKNNFNFYTNGTAPNFLGGNTYIGGTYVAPNITLSANGLGEFSGGVKVSGGLSNTDIDTTVAAGQIAYGLDSEGASALQICGGATGQWFQHSEIGFRVKGDCDYTGSQTGGLTAATKFGANGTVYYGFQERCSYDNVPGNSTKYGYYATPQNLTFASGDTGTYACFWAKAPEDTTSGNNLSYNFYAGTNAANFLSGNTYIGGNTTRNTFDLWKSTLSEEQIETLEAGTLVAPANVNVPGDGSFARQWYYDQQNAETQAELTAGTLEYPAHLTAATFTDTFALGDNTTINLLSNGRGEFSGGVNIGDPSSPVITLNKNGKITTVSSVQSTNGTQQSYMNSNGFAEFLRAGDGVYGNVRINSNSTGIAISDQTDTANTQLNYDGSSVFGGMGEFSGGVKVSGGEANNIGNGLRQKGVSTRIVNNSVDMVTVSTSQTSFNGNVVVGNQGINLTNANGLLVKSDVNFSGGDASLVMVNPETIQGTYNKLSLITARTKSNAAFTCEEYIGVELQSPIAASNMTKSDGSPTVLIGLKTSIEGTDNYNIYANQTATNYFAGGILSSNSDTFIPRDTTQSNTARGVRIQGNLSSQIQINQYSTNANHNCLELNRLGRTSGGKYISFFEDGVNTTGGIVTDSGSVAYNVGSDYRLKQAITDLSSASESIKALRPVSYSYTSHPDYTHLGFVAHELQSVVPQAVTGSKDESEEIGTLTDYDGTILETAVVEPAADELTYTVDVEVDGVSTATIRTKTWTPTGTQPVYQGVDQTKLIPLLTKALQEALDKIDTLETRLTTLENV